MEELEARHLLTPVHYPADTFFSGDWNMNLYHGCTHGCIYCDSRSLCYHLGDFDRVRPKRNALSLLENELRGKRRTGLVSMGAMTDPYNPLESKLLLTRGALQLLHRYGFGATFTTKSALCARDADLLADISRHSPVRAVLTVTCGEDALCRLIEPHVSPTSQRLAAVRTLHDHGVYTGVWIAPVLPFLTDTPENLTRILTLSAQAGAQFAVCDFGMTLRDGNREYYFAALERLFPGVRAKYLTTFGNAYHCPSPRAEALYPLFRDTCARLGLACTFPEINRETAAALPCQTTLWDQLKPAP